MDRLTARHGLTWESAAADAVLAKWRARSALLVKPLTFMNLSGRAVGELLRFFKVGPVDLLVVVDDVELELGRLRARASGSAGGHNGLKSIIGLLGTSEFARLRIGVGRGDGRRDLADHVTARFEPDERPVIEAAVERAADAVELFVRDGIQTVMTRFNARLESEGTKDERRRTKDERGEDTEDPEDPK